MYGLGLAIGMRYTSHHRSSALGRDRSAISVAAQQAWPTGTSQYLLLVHYDIIFEAV